MAHVHHQKNIKSVKRMHDLNCVTVDLIHNDADQANSR